ncbi:RDD family protein [Halobacteriovorax sp.]|uniref:RDD family protein n=1 Tax=Halobacteriovorax sp. TaxID=2020862 RepID=UPI00356632A8
MVDEDDWDFEVDAPKKKKKLTNKPLLKSSEKEDKLNLDSSSVGPRKSRRQMAREAGGTSIKDRDIIDPAAHWRRGIAFTIDFAILVFIIGIGQVASSFFVDFGQSVEEFLGPEISNSLFFDVGGVSISLILHFLIVIVPLSSSQKTLGKRILKLKILGTLKPKAPLGVIMIREYIAKPLSLLSVIGILMIPLNKRRRGLHDYISGTIVIDNL